MCTETSMHTAVSQSDASLAEFLNTPFNQNACRIAGGMLGNALASKHSSWDFSQEASKLSAVGLTTLWLVSQQNAALKSLRLSNAGVGASDSDGLARLMGTATNLATLDLSHNYLGDELDGLSVAQLSKLFRQTRSITSLDLSANGLRDEGVRAVSAIMSTNPALRTLKLNANVMGNGSFIHLLKELEGSALPLTALEVADNRLGPEGGMELAKLLHANATISSIDTRGNDLGVEVGQALLAVTLGCNPAGGSEAAARSNKTLERIDGLSLKELLARSTSSLAMGSMRLSVHDGVLIGGLLSQGSSIRAIHVPKNDLRDAGVLHLIQGLPASLEVLDVSFNGIEEAGASSIAAQLTRFAQLTYIAMGGNTIGDKGGIALASALASRQQLTACKLPSTAMGDADGGAIINAVRHLASLTLLDLGCNPEMGELTAASLRRMTEDNPKCALRTVCGIEIAHLREGGGCCGGSLEPPASTVAASGKPKANKEASGKSGTPRKGVGTPRKEVKTGGSRAGRNSSSGGVARAAKASGGDAVDLTLDLSSLTIGALEAHLIGPMLRPNAKLAFCPRFAPAVKRAFCLLLDPIRVTRDGLRVLLRLVCERATPSEAAVFIFRGLGQGSPPTFLVCDDSELSISSVHRDGNELNLHATPMSSNVAYCHSNPNRSHQFDSYVHPCVKCAFDALRFHPSLHTEVADEEAAADAYRRVVECMLGARVHLTKAPCDAQLRGSLVAAAATEKLRHAIGERMRVEEKRKPLEMKVKSAQSKYSKVQAEAQSLSLQTEYLQATVMKWETTDGPELPDVTLLLDTSVRQEALKLAMASDEKEFGIYVNAATSEIDCSICLSRAKHASILKHCGHVYCTGCIKEWLKEQNGCPQCRAKSSLDPMVAIKKISANEVIAREKKRLGIHESKLVLRQSDLEKARKELEKLTRELDSLSTQELESKQAAESVAKEQVAAAQAQVSGAFCSFVSRDVDEAMSRQVQWKEFASMQSAHYLAHELRELYNESTHYSAIPLLPSREQMFNSMLGEIRELLGVTSAQWKTMLSAPLNLTIDCN